MLSFVLSADPYAILREGIRRLSCFNCVVTFISTQIHIFLTISRRLTESESTFLFENHDKNVYATDVCKGTFSRTIVLAVRPGVVGGVRGGGERGETVIFFLPMEYQVMQPVVRDMH